MVLFFNIDVLHSFIQELLGFFFKLLKLNIQFIVISFPLLFSLFLLIVECLTFMKDLKGFIFHALNSRSSFGFFVFSLFLNTELLNTFIFDSFKSDPLLLFFCNSYFSLSFFLFLIILDFLDSCCFFSCFECQFMKSQFLSMDICFLSDSLLFSLSCGLCIGNLPSPVSFMFFILLYTMCDLTFLLFQ